MLYVLSLFDCSSKFFKPSILKNIKSFKTFISEYADSLTIGLVLFGLFLTLYFIFYQISDVDRTTLNVLSTIGTMASFFGLAIAFVQIVALKEVSEITNKTIEQTKERIILGISISDVTEAIKLISEIDSYLGNQKYEISRLKIIELSDKLIQFKLNEIFKTIIKEELVDDIIDKLNIQISTLYSIIYSEEDIKYNPEFIITDLQRISTILRDFSSRIKFKTV